MQAEGIELPATLKQPSEHLAVGLSETHLPGPAPNKFFSILQSSPLFGHFTGLSEVAVYLLGNVL